MSVELGIMCTNFIAFTVNVGDLMATVEILSETPVVNVRMRNSLMKRITYKLDGLRLLSIGPGLFDMLAEILPGPPAKPGAYLIEEVKSDVYKLIEIWESTLPESTKLEQMKNALNALSVKLTWVLQKTIEKYRS